MKYINVGKKGLVLKHTTFDSCYIIISSVHNKAPAVCKNRSEIASKKEYQFIQRQLSNVSPTRRKDFEVLSLVLELCPHRK